MIADFLLPQVLGILFIATFIRSTFGFGQALVSVPLLALIMPMKVAAPVAVLVSMTVAGIVIAQDWRHVHFRSAGWLVLPSLVGIPLGLFMLTRLPGHAVKIILAVVIIAFSALSLLTRKQATLDHDRFAWIFGLSAGILGGAYGINGPPLVVYGSLRGWSPQQFRATLQGYFLPANLIVMCGYGMTGLWTPVVIRYYLVAMPAVLVAIFLGRAVNNRMNGHSFLFYIHLGLIAAGTVLLFRSINQ